MKKFYIVIFLLIGICAELAAQIDAEATYETRALYQNLHEVSRDNLLFGHQDDTAYGIGWDAEDGRSDVKEVCGDYPAVYGWDIGGIGKSTNIDQVKFSNMKRWIKEAYERGGINTISMHLDNPYTLGDSWDNTPALSHILPGGDRHEYYISILDKLANYLNELKTDDGTFIPIVFRPYHEHTQTWSWWGRSACSEEEFTALWKMTIDYFINEHNIHHLLYAISPQDQWTLEGYFFRYPGDDYVDIMGFDYYSLTSPSNAPQLGRILALLGDEAEKRGKVSAITETGVEAVPFYTWWTDCLYRAFNYNESSRKTAWALVWRNAHEDHFFAPYPGQASAPDFIEFYNYTDTYFEADLPSMYQFNSNDNQPPVVTLQSESIMTSYDRLVNIRISSDERAYFRYSFKDEEFTSMPFSFLSGQGGYDHSTDIPLEHGNEYTVYIRASDVYNNYASTSISVSIIVDTTKLEVAWNELEFIDDDWSDGITPLGYNADDLVTEVSNSRTIYLRKFVELPEALNGLGLLVRGHDGFIAYINGIEIDRTNMPMSGIIDNDTFAVSDLPVAPVYVLSSDVLESLGTDNLLAIELHTADVANADLSFDARLFNNEGFYIDLGSDWKYYDKGTLPLPQVVDKPTSVENRSGALLNVFKLHQNFPNPFNPETTVEYSIPVGTGTRTNAGSLQLVQLVIYDILGREVTTLINGLQRPGNYSVTFDASQLSSGIYFYQLKSGKYSETKKMILIK